MVIKGLKKLILVLLLVMSFQVIPVRAQEEQLSKVTSEKETEEVVKKKRNIFEEFHYRVFLKDTRDFFDFILLGIFITGLLIVLVFKNTHYVVVQKSLEAKTFLETGNTYSVEEISPSVEVEVEDAEIVEEKEDEVAEIVENSEILSSDDLEEEQEQVPMKKDKKKRRA